MGRTGFIPPELTRRPFSLQEAERVGLSRHVLEGTSWRRLGRGLYCWSGMPTDPWLVLKGWQSFLPGVIFSGATAAWLLGLEFEPLDPITLIAPPKSGIRSRAGVVARHCRLRPSDVVRVRGLAATSPCLTLRHLSRRLDGVEILVAFDAALRLGLVDKSALSRMRSVGALAEPAESPMETRLRWLLLRARLPRPDVQAELRNPAGRLIGRADLYYPSARLVLEYDGADHRERLVEDDRRQNNLVDAGYKVLRFTASDVYQRPQAVVQQVRRGLLGR